MAAARARRSGSRSASAPAPANGDGTPERILGAAAELFAAAGFHATSVRDIAARARANVAASHYHFGSKLDLYLEVARAQFGEVGERLAARGSAPSDAELGRASRAELERRLRSRGTDPEEVIQRRLRDAAADMTHWREFGHAIVNDDFERAVEDLTMGDLILTADGRSIPVKWMGRQTKAKLFTPPQHYAPVRVSASPAGLFVGGRF